MIKLKLYKSLLLNFYVSSSNVGTLCFSCLKLCFLHFFIQLKLTESEIKPKLEKQKSFLSKQGKVYTHVNYESAKFRTSLSHKLLQSQIRKVTGIRKDEGRGEWNIYESKFVFIVENFIISNHSLIIQQVGFFLCYRSLKSH